MADMEKIKEGAKELKKLLKKGMKKVTSTCKKTWYKVRMLQKVQKVQKKLKL